MGKKEDKSPIPDHVRANINIKPKMCHTYMARATNLKVGRPAAAYVAGIVDFVVGEVVTNVRKVLECENRQMATPEDLNASFTMDTELRDALNVTICDSSIRPKIYEVGDDGQTTSRKQEVRFRGSKRPRRRVRKPKPVQTRPASDNEADSDSDSEPDHPTDERREHAAKALKGPARGRASKGLKAPKRPVAAPDSDDDM